MEETEDTHERWATHMNLREPCLNNTPDMRLFDY